MTTWVIGHSNRFKAAIIGAPVSHQQSMRGTSDIPLFSDFEIGGTPYDNLEEWRLRSPLSYLHNVTTPALIEHHEGDLRCPIGQGEEIFQNLKLLGKEVEFLRYPGGFHTLETHLPSQDVDYMERAIAWFNQHLPRPSATKVAAHNGSAPARKRELVSS
jgi:dipeptidyl aminopeptidase/acylaminoacyl peptidase